MRQIAFTCLLALVAAAGCRKMEMIGVSFDVTTEKTTYKISEPVIFKLNGNPGTLTFYSGETGKRFEFAERVTADGTPLLQFTSLAANGAQTNTLSLVVSKNFKGIGADETATAANIAAATWTDITNRANLSAGASTASGAIDLSDFATDGNPVYIAFKYKSLAGSIQRKWTISGLTVVNKLTDGTQYTLVNLNNTAIANYGVSLTTSPGWVGARVANTYAWAISAGSSLTITGATTDAAATADSEAWVFSGPVYLDRVTPDRGAVIKNISTRITSYTYIYKTAGTYTAVFDGNTQTQYENNGAQRQVQLTIVP